MARREHGALEHDVLAALWAADEPQSPEQVRHVLGSDLAYTTVQTILVRLHAKGVVTREQVGRAFHYSPAVDEAGLTALRMRQLLTGESDREGVLSRFAADLTSDEADALRRALRGVHR